MATNKQLCLPSTEKSSSVTTLSVASASCLDFFFFPRIIGGVLLLAQHRGSHSAWIHGEQGASALLQTGESPLQLTPKKRGFFLLYLPKFMHHLACPERHVMVKKLTVLDFLS